MEIATNMVQTMGTEALAVASGAQANASAAPSSSSDGVFALFFEQLLGEISGVMPEVKLNAVPEREASATPNEPARKEEETTEKEGKISVAIPVELQAALSMQMAVTPQSATDRQEVESVSPATEAPVEGVTMVRNNPAGMTAVGPASLPENAVAEGIKRASSLPVQPKEERPVSPAELPATPSVKSGPAAPVEIKVVREAATDAVPAKVVIGTNAAAEQNAPAPENAAQPDLAKTAEPPLAKAVPPSASAEAVQPKPSAKAMEVQKETPGETSVGKTGTGVERVAVKETASRQFQGGDQQEPQEKPVTKGKEALATAPVQAEAPRPFEPAKPSLAAVQPENPPVPEHEHIMAQVREKISVHQIGPGNGEISLKLHPEELGELKIMLKMTDQRLKVEIIAQNHTVREALMQNLDGLRESLSRQNISVDRFDVTTGGGPQQEFHEGRQAARERFLQQSQTVKVALPEQEQSVVANVWKPRENSLVDVRF